MLYILHATAAGGSESQRESTHGRQQTWSSVWLSDRVHRRHKSRRFPRYGSFKLSSSTCICRNIGCALGKWSLHSRWNLSRLSLSLHVHGDQLKWRQIRISAVSWPRTIAHSKIGGVWPTVTLVRNSLIHAGDRSCQSSVLHPPPPPQKKKAQKYCWMTSEESE